MSWLHCMWGVGASLGPYIMGFALSGGQGWNMGYRYVALLQIGLTAVLFLSLPLWKRQTVAGVSAVDVDLAQQGENDGGSTVRAEGRALSLRQVVQIPGAKEVMLTFFCYCSLEATAGLWASSYLVIHRGVASDTAARFASLFYIGITVGRALGGFLTMKLNDEQMIRLGQGFVLVGIILLFLPFGEMVSLFGLIIIGLGCAPIYPSIIHSTPAHFGADKSQAVIGVQMASAYVGTCLMPPLFGLIANHISVALYPLYLAVILAVMFIMHERLLGKTK